MHSSVNKSSSILFLKNETGLVMEPYSAPFAEWPAPQSVTPLDPFPSVQWPRNGTKIRPPWNNYTLSQSIVDSFESWLLSMLVFMCLSARSSTSREVLRTSSFLVFVPKSRNYALVKIFNSSYFTLWHSCLETAGNNISNCMVPLWHGSVSTLWWNKTSNCMNLVHVLLFVSSVLFKTKHTLLYDLADLC